MNINQVKKAILNKWSFESPECNIPLFIWSNLGLGKTWIVQECLAQKCIYELEKFIKAGKLLTQEQERELSRLKSYTDPKEIEDLLDKHMVILRLANSPIEKLQGVPFPKKETLTALFLMPENISRFGKDDFCLVFLDELDKASEAALCATTHLIESRRIGDFIFPKDTMILAAANRIQDSWLSKPIPPELRNRAAHVELEPDIDTWLNWARNHGVRQEIIHFLKFKKSLNENFLTTYENQDGENQCNAFATPRTLFMASNQWDKMEKKGASYQEILDEVRQLVGDKFSNELNCWIKLYRQINVEGILDGSVKIPKALPGDNKAISNQYIHVFAICSYIKVEHIKEDSRMINLMTAIESLNDDLKIAFLLTLTSSKPDVNNFMHASPHSERLIDWFLDKVSKI